MPRPLWTGSLSFGLVNIPVKVYSATSPQTLDFDLLRKSDLSPIKYLRVARADGKEVPYDQIVRGYEYQKGDYVVLTEDDFKKADVKKTKSIEIIDFVKDNEIDDIFYEKPYYLEPTEGSAKAYALLVEALKRSGKVGVARFVMRTREHIAALRPKDNMLILDQLRFNSEIKPTTDIKQPILAEKNDREIDVALQLIEQMTEHFNPADYKDTYNDELLEIINEKAERGTVKPRGQEPKPTEVVDLMAQLKKSLELAGNKE